MYKKMNMKKQSAETGTSLASQQKRYLYIYGISVAAYLDM